MDEKPRKKRKYCGQKFLSKCTPEVVSKLEEAFAYGCTDAEACLYAGISESLLASYQRTHPKFLDRKRALKESPMLLARRTVVDNLGEPEHAKWFLARKRRDEFSERTEVATTGEIKIVIDDQDEGA